MHDRTRFSRQIDPGLPQKPELFKIVVILLRSYSKSHRYENGIAGIHGRLNEIFRTVSSHFMASDLPVFHDHITRTAKMIVDRNDACRKPRCRRNNLKCRSRFISIVDRIVTPHPVQSVLIFFVGKLFLGRRYFFRLLHGFSVLFHFRLHLFIKIGIRQSVRFVQIKFGNIGHGKQFPVLYLHHDNTDAVRLFGLHDLIGQLCGVSLDIDIHTDVQVIAAYRFYPAFTACGKFHPFGIRPGKDHALRSFHILIIDHFQTDNTLIIASCKS